jgi:hypothetical protein
VVVNWDQPSSLMMQVPVRQHLGSSVMGAPFFARGFAIGSSVICNLSVIELHGWISQSALYVESFLAEYFLM